MWKRKPSIKYINDDTTKKKKDLITDYIRIFPQVDNTEF